MPDPYVGRVAGLDDLAGEWEAFATEWITRCETDADAARVGLLDDWMLRVIGDVAERRVIDLGCGEGRFCRTLAGRGADTLGVDLQEAFITYAASRAGPNERYAQGDMQALEQVPDAAFDLAVSYISLVDVPDQAAVVREAFRVGSCDCMSRSPARSSSRGSPPTGISSECRSSRSTTSRSRTTRCLESDIRRHLDGRSSEPGAGPPSDETVAAPWAQPVMTSSWLRAALASNSASSAGVVS